MTTLFELSGKYLEVKQLSEQGVDEQVIIDTLESINDEIEDKADGYAAVIKHLKSNVSLIDDEISRLQKLKATHKNTEKRMKDNLLESMKSIGREKFRTDLNNFYIQKNPMSLQIEDENKIPDTYFITKKQLDKKALLEHMKNSGLDEFSGARINQEEGVRIR